MRAPRPLFSRLGPRGRVRRPLACLLPTLVLLGPVGCVVSSPGAVAVRLPSVAVSPAAAPALAAPLRPVVVDAMISTASGLPLDGFRTLLERELIDTLAARGYTAVSGPMPTGTPRYAVRLAGVLYPGPDFRLRMAVDGLGGSPPESGGHPQLGGGPGTPAVPALRWQRRATSSSLTLQAPLDSLGGLAASAVAQELSTLLTTSGLVPRTGSIAYQAARASRDTSQRFGTTRRTRTTREPEDIEIVEPARPLGERPLGEPPRQP